VFNPDTKFIVTQMGHVLNCIYCSTIIMYVHLQTMNTKFNFMFSKTKFKYSIAFKLLSVPNMTITNSSFLSQTGIFKLSHSNCALTKNNIFSSLHNFILQYNMTNFYTTFTNLPIIVYLSCFQGQVFNPDTQFIVTQMGHVLNCIYCSTTIMYVHLQTMNTKFNFMFSKTKFKYSIAFKLLSVPNMTITNSNFCFNVLVYFTYFFIG
jgi:hypothetical protein